MEINFYKILQGKITWKKKKIICEMEINLNKIYTWQNTGKKNITDGNQF